ncbi:arginine decarboxylase, partial [Streptomyces sp. CC53]|uniref:arginine decarboxylase n=1 Tax=unclassified Streptomyces TaxID=2593676 RepID=UPI0008DCC0FD
SPSSASATAPEDGAGGAEPSPVQSSRSAAPLADALQALADRDLTSFHALPGSHGDSLRDSAFRERYTALFGSRMPAADVSYSGAMLDSYFSPRGPLREAQRLAADAFGADHTFFLSTGTSTTNRVVLGAFARAGDRVLADRTCHQSVHFTLPGLGVAVDYAPVRSCCDRCPREFADLPRLLEMYGDAVREGRPYDVVVLSAASYDGIRYHLPAVLGALAEIRPDVRVVVDEAWGAAHHFHPALRPLTALGAWGALSRSGPVDGRMELAVTHSAHKSLSALRQGSYLHLVGSEELRRHTAQELFQQHTTSPSWPVLASLDLARAQAVAEGERHLGRSMDLARAVRDAIATDPGLSAYEILDPDRPALRGLLAEDDPLRVMVGLRNVGVSPAEFRRTLFEEHGLYISRECGEAVLLHLHIGVDERAVGRLLDAMRAVQRAHRTPPAAEGRSEHFVIAYPPGIPIAVPGEQMDAGHHRRIAALRAKGSEIYTVRGRGPAPAAGGGTGGAGNGSARP